MINVKKIQTETMWEIEYEGVIYTIMQIEDFDFKSGWFSWEVWDENSELLEDEELEAILIESIIKNL